MYRFKSLLLLSSMLLAAFFIPSKAAAAFPTINRISGSNRYETNISILKNGWSEASNIIVANGENYPDALCAAPLAKAKNAPIILTTKNELNSSALSELLRLKTKNAYIIGGTGVISEEVETQLKNLGINILRIAGANRYETSVKIAEQIGTEKGIVIASGENFPDALSIAPIAAQKGMPILLSSKTSLPNEVKVYLQDKNIPVSYVIGGLGALSSEVKSSLKNPIRLSGMNRYETNINIINQFEDSLDFKSIYIASAQNFPDALSGSVLASNSNAPIILMDNNIPEVSSDYMKSINSKTINILGGTGALNEATENILKDIVKFLTITNADNISDLALVGEDYQFPTTALATYENSSTKLVPVKWNSKAVDTSKPSTYTFEGTVSGYDKKIQMNLKAIDEAELINRGNFVYYKNNLYFANIDDDSKIYKVDNTGKMIKINDEYSSDINIVKDHIYYRSFSKLYKMNLDGSEKVEIITDANGYTSGIENLVVKGDWIYYTYVEQKNYGLFKVKTDGSNKTKLSDNYASEINLVNDYIYYTNSSDGHSIYKIKVDGSERTKISTYAGYGLNIVDNWIYYLVPEGAFTEKGQQTKIYKIKTDGTEKTKIYDGWARGLKVYGEWIYFSNPLDGDKLYRIRKDGTSKTMLVDSRTAGINIIGEWIFYDNLNYNSASFAVKLDGSSNGRFGIPVVYENESNDTPSSATDLNTVQSYGDTKKAQGHIINSDVDYFKIKTEVFNSPYYLNVVFASPSIGSNAVVTFLDEQGNIIYSTQTSYNGIASFSIDMPTDVPASGTYYIKVSSPNGSLIETGEYDLLTWYEYHS